MAKIKRYVYCVFFDSSALHGEPIAQQIVDFIGRYKEDDRVTIKIYIPDLVSKELDRRLINLLIDRHKQAAKNLKTVQFFFPEITHTLPDEITEDEVLRAKTRILANLDIEVVPTPISKIKWNDIIDRAARYLPPFEETKEKGFKDIVIAETAVHHFLSSSRKFTYAFVGSDMRMNSYLHEKTDQFKKFNVFESLPALETDIKLRLDESTEKIVDAIKKSAYTAFYESGNETSIYLSTGISKQLNHLVNELLLSEEFVKRYPNLKVVGHSSLTDIEIARPIFIDRPDKTTFCWRSVVIGEVKVDITRTGDAVSRAGSIMLEFEVGWQAAFTRKGEVQRSKAKVNEIKISSYDLVYEYSSGLTPIERLTQQLTTIGQPTFPVNTFETIQQAAQRASNISATFNGNISNIQDAASFWQRRLGKNPNDKHNKK